MKIALFGASGMIGQRIRAEALRRGHEVTAIVRDPAKLDTSDAKLTAVAGNANNATSVAAAVSGHDAVISAIGPGQDQDPQFLVQAAETLIQGLQRAGVKRLLVVGGAGSLEVAPGLQLVDTPNFPAMLRPLAAAHRDAITLYQTADLDWTVLCPAITIEPGERTGTFQTGGKQLLTNAAGDSRISAEDYAIALLDELEQGKHLREQFTVAY